MSEIKRVYSFGGKTADGDGSMKNLLGGKGANHEWPSIGSRLTITTEFAPSITLLDAIIPKDWPEVAQALKNGDIMGTRFVTSRTRSLYPAAPVPEAPCRE